MFPKLRFKEFDGDWLKTTIGAKSEIVTSGSRDWAQYYSDSGDKFIRMTNLVRNGINLDLSDLRFVQLPVGSNEGKRTSLEKGDILISITAELGKLGWIPEGLGTAYINQHTALVRMKNTLDSKFVAYALSTEKYNNKLNSLNDSGAKAGLNLGTIRSFELTIPSKPEQTQIASFLSVVDEKISQLTQKLELLSQYKQGMMQKLFSQQIRFKADDGSEFGEWGEYKIFDLAIDKTLNNGVFNDQNKVGKGYKLINVLDMYIQRDIDESRLSLLDLDKKEFENNKVNYGDIFFTRSSLVKEGIAFSNVYLGVSDDITYDGHLIKLSPDLNMVEPKFLNYCLKIAYVRKQLIQGGKTATMTTIGQKEVGNTIVKVPCLEEQTKIANFLSSIDQKIEVVAQQIEQAKQWKKGLLQQMFV